MSDQSSWFAWLIERGDGGPPMYRTMKGGQFAWTLDPLEALHFCRREDAERVAAEDEDAWRISQHGFVGPEVMPQEFAGGAEDPGAPRCPGCGGPGTRSDKEDGWFKCLSSRCCHPMWNPTLVGNDPKA